MHRGEVAPRGRVAWAALLALLLAGCPSLLTMGPARTVPKGSTESWVAVGAYRTILVTKNDPTQERTAEWMPLVDVGARIGLGGSVDLGFRAGLGSASIGPRFQLVRAASIESGVDLQLEPSLGVTGVLPGGKDSIISGFSAALALPFGLNLGHGSQLVLTPRVAQIFDRAIGDVTMPGGSVALVLRVGGTDEQPWFIIPECGASTVSGLGRAFDGPNLQCALGLAGPFR